MTKKLSSEEVRDLLEEGREASKDIAKRFRGPPDDTTRIEVLESTVLLLTARVVKLEEQMLKARPPLKKRVKLYLQAENNNLYYARERARNADDDEAVKEIQKLWDKAD